MSKYSLGKVSLKRLDTCHSRIQTWVKTAMGTSPLDFGVVCGFRDETKQRIAFEDGFSKADWGQSPHNWQIGDVPCSLAVDLVPYHNGYLWEDSYRFEILKMLLLTIAKNVGLQVIWGGNFKSFTDLPHWEIKI